MIIPTFVEFLKASGHDINNWTPAALESQAAVIGRYFVFGNSALDGHAHDATCVYCHNITYGHFR